MNLSTRFARRSQAPPPSSDTAPKLPPKAVPVSVPLPIKDPSPLSPSVSQYMPRPETTNIGLTARVVKILAGAEQASDSIPVENSERMQWSVEKLGLTNKVQALQEELGRLKGERFGPGHKSDMAEYHYSGNHKNPQLEGLVEGRPAPREGILAEVEMLRKENEELRNMTRDEKQGKAKEIMLKLRREIEALKSENLALRRQISAVGKENEAKLKPPADSDLRMMREGDPFMIRGMQKDRILQVLQDEWKSSFADSRHGGAEPLKSPFQKRR